MFSRRRRADQKKRLAAKAKKDQTEIAQKVTPSKKENSQLDEHKELSKEKFNGKKQFDLPSKKTV